MRQHQALDKGGLFSVMALQLSQHDTTSCDDSVVDALFALLCWRGGACNGRPMSMPLTQSEETEESTAKPG